MPEPIKPSNWVCLTPWGFTYRPAMDSEVPGYWARKFGEWTFNLKWEYRPLTPIEMFMQEKNHADGQATESSDT